MDKTGLLDSTAMSGPEGAPMDGKPMPAKDGMPQDPGQESGEQASPEEQQAYENFVGTALTLMSEKKVTDGLLQQLKAGDPVEGLARATVAVIERVEKAAGQKQKAIDPMIIMHGGKEIMENLAELSMRAKVHDFSEEELENAALKAIDTYREQKQASGQLDEGKAKEELQMLQQADQQGNLDQLLPGISQYAQKAGAA